MFELVQWCFKKKNWFNSYRDSPLFSSISNFIIKCALISIKFFYKAWNQACLDLSCQPIMWQLNKSLTH